MRKITIASVALGAAAAIAACTTMSQAPAGGLAIETVSNRADLISGGDALVRVSLPAGADASSARLAVNGKAVDASALHVAPDGKGWLALVGGLNDGRNDVSLTYGGKTVHLDVTSHPNGGPIFSGPQILPWTCRDGATDKQCDRPTTISYSYLPIGGKEFKPYDPKVGAKDVVQATTTSGATLPYIVRTESFSQDRSGVSVAVLFDPAQDWKPYQPQKQWNHSVLVLQGSGCGTGYGEQPAGSPMNDRALKQGYAVLTVALLHNTINCNPIVQAEAALMAKEHVIETYGPIDMFFGMGSSGGAISQLMDQNAYPGLYDGLILNHLFTDSDASRRAAYDCRMVYDAWAKSKEKWTEDQKVAVVGMISGCNASPTRYEIYAPALGTNCDIPDAQKFDAVKNPKGVRCTLQDYEVNQVGRRPDGAANGRVDTVGVQYGLKALMAGTITPAQFVELNTSIGGHDINFKPTPNRTEADQAGLAKLYETGVVNPESNLRDTPMIETRLSVTDFHQPFHAVMVRARLDRAQGGNHDNYALWKTPAGREAKFEDSFDVMVAWMKAIEADTRDIPKARKVVEDKPALAKDRCIVEGSDQALSACVRPLELTRTLAGAPDTNDTGKCQLKPLRRADYGKVSFTDEQWASLQKVFPSGVCDYSKPLVDFRYTIPWLTYSGDGQYKPLGPAPKSH